MTEQTDALVRLIVAHMAAGTLDAARAVPALAVVAGVSGEPVPRSALLEALREHQRTADAASARALQPLVDHLSGSRLADAEAAFALLRSGRPLTADLESALADLPRAPLGWARLERGHGRVRRALALARDRAFVAEHPGLAGTVEDAVVAAYQAACADLLRLPTAFAALPPATFLDEPGSGAPLDALWAARAERGQVWARAALEGADPALPSDADEDAALAVLAAAFQAPGAPVEHRRRILDLLLAWPTDRVIGALLASCTEEWAQERAALVLTLRFGRAHGPDWASWTRWLSSLLASADAPAPPADALPGELARLFADSQRAAAGAGSRVGTLPLPEEFIERWQELLTARQRQELLGRPPSAPLPDVSAELQGRADTAAPEPPPPPPPSRGLQLWRDHLQGFLAENWYMAAGVLMVLVGSALLAYFTWDKHWLLRYTIMPALLFGFTSALARTAAWLEARDPTFRPTGATLRGAAIALLPLNFMAVALLAEDPQVSLKAVVVPVMAALYVLLFGRGLLRWCRDTDPALDRSLPLALLLLNGLVLLRPLSRGALPAGWDVVVLAAGFHLGFAVMAYALVRFARSGLDAARAAERRVPWFVGGVLAVTFLEVFVLVHGSMHRLPPAHTYAVLVVLAGGLVLHLERRFLSLRGQEGQHAAESFLGFAVVLLGVLMAAADPYARIVTLLVAGGVWLWQAAERRERTHQALGLTLLLLGGASFGLLPGFPGEYQGALGIVLALAAGALGVLAGRRGLAPLAEACGPMQAGVLVLSAVVAVLGQWHERSAPWVTALTLVVAATLLAWRAWRDDSLRLVHASAMVLALALPYLGFVDVLGHTLHGNTLVAGLGLLGAAWIALVALRPAPLLLEARSSVLWLYGGLAVTALLLRVVIEGGLPVDPRWERVLPELGGPVLMAAVLVAAGYYSRSLVPMAMAAVMVVVLVPALKANLNAAFPHPAHGPGLGSAEAALAMLLLAFALRRAPALRALGAGDRLLGHESFPFLRHDAVLFTGPLLASVLFLTIKVDTWTLLGQVGRGVPLRTAVAVLVTSLLWTLLAAYFHERRGAEAGVHLGWLTLVLGIWLGYRVRWPEGGFQWPVLAMLVVLQVAEIGYRRLAAAGHAWAVPVLAEPTRAVLVAGSRLLALALVVALVQGARVDEVHALGLFVAGELLYSALARRRFVDGTLAAALGLFALLALAARPGPDALFYRLSARHGLTAVLVAALAVQALQLVLEAAPDVFRRLRPVADPAQVYAVLITAGLAAWALLDVLTGPVWASAQVALLVLALLLAARAQALSPLVLPAAGLVYLLVQAPRLHALGVFGRVALLAEPWRLAVLALGLALAAAVGRAGARRAPRAFAGPFALLPPVPEPAAWLEAPAVMLALSASVRHAVVPALRGQAAQLAVPYLSAITALLVGLAWSSGVLFGLAVALVSLGNVHAVRLFLGAPLRERGLEEMHLVALGLGLTLALGSALRALVRKPRAASFLSHASLVLAAAILALLSANYAADPNLADITTFRFAVSGLMALAASLYFRRAARSPDARTLGHESLCEGLYHFGLAVALWCLALLAPWFRQPATVLLALGLPALYFYVRAEQAPAGNGTRYRDSASVLGFVLLGLFALRPVFQMILFPDTPVRTEHYHDNAAFVAVLGLLLIRLRGLGGTEWLAFYGGLALMTGSFFGLTAVRGFSPFGHPTAAAWCGIGLAHFWTTASGQRSPVRAVLQHLAEADGATWVRLRRAWGRTVLAAAQGLGLLAIVHPGTDTHDIAPLLVGMASVFVHHAVLEGSGWRYGVAAAQCALALHADFLVPSDLPRRQVVWVLLLLWAVLLLFTRAHAALSRVAGGASAVFALAVFGHVLYHHPGSSVGLFSLAFAAVLCLLTPRSAVAPQSPEESAAAALLLAVPSWLVYWSQAGVLSPSPATALAGWQVLATAATVFATGLAARIHASAREPGAAPPPAHPVVLHQVLAFARQHGRALFAAVLPLVTVAAVMVQVAHHATPFAGRDLALLALLELALAIGWYQESRERRQALAFLAAEACVLAAAAAVRRQLLLTTPFWSHEHDVWASLGVSFLLTGARDFLETQPRETRRPLIGTLLALPAVALVWTLVHGLGVDVALLVIGVHSLMFAYLGKGRRDSPYNVVAMGGFVCFVLVVFWTKLELRVLHAYVIPVGLAVLALLQVFGRQLPSETRNRVRLVTLLAMLGSTAYYALADERHPLAFNLTLLVLCLVAMALGSALRVRLYLVLGFVGVAADLASILVKSLVHLDRGERMTSVGVLVLLLGAGLVGGAVYYKTHRERIEEYFEAWRARLTAWE